MSEEFADFAIWQAASLGDPSKAGATFVIQQSSTIRLDYCIPLSWTKKRTDLTGVQEEEDVHPDTGPAGGLVELQITLDRAVGCVPVPGLPRTTTTLAVVAWCRLSAFLIGCAVFCCKTG